METASCAPFCLGELLAPMCVALCGSVAAKAGPLRRPPPRWLALGHKISAHPEPFLHPFCLVFRAAGTWKTCSGRGISRSAAGGCDGARSAPAAAAGCTALPSVGWAWQVRVCQSMACATQLSPVVAVGVAPTSPA